MIKLLIAAIACLTSAITHAQDGTLDTSFVDPSGYRIFSFSAQDIEQDTVGALHVLPSGRVLYGLTTNGTAGGAAPVVVNMMAEDGGNAPAFFSPVGLGGPGASFASLAVQADGKVLVLITDPTAPFNTCFLYRLLSDGTPDGLFGPAGRRTVVFNVPLSDGVVTGAEVVVQADGKVLVAATIGPLPKVGHAYSSTLAMAVTRLQSSGQIDPGYGNGGTAIITRFAEIKGSETHELLKHARLADDGGLLLVGATNYDPDVALTGVPLQRQGAIAKLNSSGAADASFGDGSVVILGAFDTVKDIQIQGGGFYVVLGDGVLRFAANGHRDFSFGVFGTAHLDVIDGTSGSPVVPGLGSSLAIQSDGKIVVGGSVFLIADAKNHSLAYRFTSDGFADPSYGDGICGPGASVSSWTTFQFIIDSGDGEIVALQNDRTLLSGRLPSMQGYHGVVYRLKATIDSVFRDGFE